jgi:hypothetical protein
LIDAIKYDDNHSLNIDFADHIKYDDNHALNIDFADHIKYDNNHSLNIDLADHIRDVKGRYDEIFENHMCRHVRTTEFIIS